MEGKFAYILCKKTVQDVAHLRRKSYTNNRKNKTVTSINMLPTSKTLLDNSEIYPYAILKYNIQNREEVKDKNLFKISAKCSQTFEFLQDAERDKNKLKCHFIEERRIFILHISMINAVLVLELKGGHENLLESGKDKRHQYANQRFYIDKGKCLQVIK